MRSAAFAAFPFKWNTRVFNVFQRPGSKSGTGLVRLGCTWKFIVLLQQGAIFLEKPWFCCNRVQFSSKINGFVATGYHFPRKPWFCCNRVPLSSKNNGFVATGCNFPRKTMVLLQQGAIFHPKQWIFHLKPSISWRRDREVFGLPCYQTDEEKSWKNAQKCAPPPKKKQKKPKTMKTAWSSARDLFFVMD